MEIKFDGADEDTRLVTFSEMKPNKFYKLVELDGSVYNGVGNSLYARINADTLLEFRSSRTMPLSAAIVGRYVLETRLVAITIKS